MLLGGCDSSLASREFRGVPLHRFVGRLTGDGPAQAPASPNVAVVWLDVNRLADPPSVVGELVRISNLGFPATFEVELYASPPAQALGSSGAGTGAIGAVVVVDDRDGDGRLAVDASASAVPPDVIFGAAYEHLLLYATPPLAPGGFIENPADARQGYQALRLLCGSPLQLKVVAHPEELLVTMSRGGRIEQSELSRRCLPR